MTRESKTGWIFSRTTRNGTVFWKGRMRHDGEPETTPRRDEAYSFHTMWGAMQCGDTHRALRNSLDWKVVPR